MGSLVGSCSFRFVRLAETIAGIRHRESAVLMCRDLEIVSSAVVLGRWRSMLPLRGRLDRSYRRGGQGFVEQIRDEHARHGIFLTAQEREVHLPNIDEARRSEKHLHCFGLSPFARSVIHDRNSRMKRVDEQFRIEVAMTSE